MLTVKKCLKILFMKIPSRRHQEAIENKEIKHGLNSDKDTFVQHLTILKKETIDLKT